MNTIFGSCLVRLKHPRNEYDPFLSSTISIKSDRTGLPNIGFQLNSSHLVYRWDLGSGVGVVQSMKHVSDGEWHTVRLSRNGRTSRIVVDSDPGVEGKSPSGEILHANSRSL